MYELVYRSSAVFAIGAATLADIFDPVERGTKMGLYYSAPLLGPSLGPIIGGALTQGFGWRGPFWFLTILGGLNLLSFLVLFKDTFRRQRSLTYQNVLVRRLREQAHKQLMESSQVAISKTASKNSPSQTSLAEKRQDSEQCSDLEKGERDTPDNVSTIAETKSSKVIPSGDEIKLSFMDINPLKPLWLVIRRKNNLAILFSSGKLAGSCPCSYHCTKLSASLRPQGFFTRLATLFPTHALEC